MRTTYNTRLVGILCHPKGEELIHDMFTAAVEIAGADVAPLQFDTQISRVEEKVHALQAVGADGVYLIGRLRNSLIGSVDYLSDEAHGAGVINAITFDGDQTTGHNTEAQALVAVLEPYKERFVNGSAVILGGGAMARSALFAAIRHFRINHVAIADRTLQQAQLLKQVFTTTKTKSQIEAHELFPPDIAQLLAEARLIINATAVGSYPDVEESPITLPDLFHNRQVVVDTNYSPAVTRMLNDAAESGSTTVNGVEILLQQVARAFEILTGAQFPTEEIRKLLITNKS